VAIGDVHGDHDALVAVLRMAGVVDASLRWIAGDTHVVQIGDIPSRGPRTRQCFDLLMRLEPEALRAGGRLHALIGNHDAGVIYGDRRNVLPEEYAEFRTPESEALLEAAWRAESTRYPKTDRELWFSTHAPGFVEHTRAFGPAGTYGAWIRRNNAVVRINDTLFVHGGISPKYRGWTRTRLNETIRRELADPARLIPGLTSDVLGPLWYRGFAEDDGPEIEAHLRAVLQAHGVRRIVFGHSVTRSAILPRFEHRAIDIDLGLSRFYGRPPSCLVIEQGEASVLFRQQRIALKGSLRSYLEAIVALDGPDSPVLRLLRQLDEGVVHPHI
jgi:hypothetical protein